MARFGQGCGVGDILWPGPKPLFRFRYRANRMLCAIFNTFNANMGSEIREYILASLMGARLSV